MELLKRPSSAQLSAADASTHLVLAPAAGALARLVTLMSRGCFVRVNAGATVRELVVDQLHVSPRYLEQEIKIIFLDSSPVDDLDRAFVRDGATLALSAAMPGLVGAAMRRDGPSWLRASITHHETEDRRPLAPGVIFLKLFNQVMADLGEGILRRGVYLEGSSLAAFLEGMDQRFWSACPITLDAQPLSAEALTERIRHGLSWLKLSLPGEDEPARPRSDPWN